MIGYMDCAALMGFGATEVRVEVDISRGLPSFLLVGLPENSIKEARVRVQAAIINAGFDFPRGKISVNLAPADLQKSGTSFDLPIAIAILQASGVIPRALLEGIAAMGELSLAGEIRPVRGMLALAESMQMQGYRVLLVSEKNAKEANLIKGLDVRIVRTFAEVVRAIVDDQIGSLPKPSTLSDGEDEDEDEDHLLDMGDVVGQDEARRALLIAAAGDHNLLFIGGPGSGKSMMANRMPSILPPLSHEEAMSLTKIYSIAGLTIAKDLIRHRPFRAPHHSITRAGLVGGGSRMIRPGEISLACFGVLFLDELLEFPRTILEVLRQPLEDGSVTISRANMSVTYPASISLVGALNPCPCGNFRQGKKICHCSALSIERYQGRLSGPLMDRIDLHVQVPPVNLNMMNQQTFGESSREMRKKVKLARAIQKARFKKNLTNGKMSRGHIRELAKLSSGGLSFLLRCAEKLSISARGFDRIIRVARTIADLDESKEVHERHVGEAFQYRPASPLLSS